MQFYFISVSKKSRRQSLAQKINGIEDDNIENGAIEETTVIDGTISGDESDPENDDSTQWQSEYLKQQKNLSGNQEHS